MCYNSCTGGELSMINLSEYIGSKIKTYRERRNMTQEELAESLQTTRQSISRYESGERKANQDILFKLTKIFNISINDFFPPMENNINIYSVYNLLDPIRQRKVYSFAEKQLYEQNKKQTIKVIGQTAAGEPIVYGDSIVEEKEVSYVPKGAECALNVKGDSMEPSYPDGSIVFYKKSPDVEHGQIAIVEIDGEAVTCKKVLFDYDKQEIILRSLNEKYEDVSFNSDRVRIIGIVVK